MKVAFIGCVDFSHAMLAHLLNRSEVEVVGIVTRAASDFNADFKSLAPLAESHGVPCFLADGKDQSEIATWLKAQVPDVIFCLGWSFLLNHGILGAAPGGVIGYHPAPLPRGRGRHPLIWALALGLRETASCFFLMDSGADSGDIVSRQPVPIADEDDAGTLMAKITDAARGQLDAIVDHLAGGALPRQPQRHEEATSWRKRSPADGAIDWRMSAPAIHNLVRALTRPYVGAHFEHGGRDVKVWKTRPQETDIVDIEPGKVLKVEGTDITVKCGGGAIALVEHDMADLPEIGDYL